MNIINVKFILTLSLVALKYAALLRPPMEIKRLFFHFKTSYNKTDASVFNLTDI